MDEVSTRPASIMMFERLYLLAIAMEVTDIVLDWPSLQSSASRLLLRLGAVVASLLLVLLASRRRQRMAGCILAALFVIGLPMVATALRPAVPLEASMIILLQVVLQAIALVFLLRPASREWFAGTAPVERAESDR